MKLQLLSDFNDRMGQKKICFNSEYHNNITNMYSLVFELYFVYRWTHASENGAILLHASLGRH